MKLRRLMFCTFLIPLFLAAQIPDAKIPQSVQRYFHMNRLGPELVSAEVFDHFQTGRTIKLKIVANRNKSSNDLAFAFAAAAAVANFAEKPIELLWVEMDINFKDSEPTMAIAPAKCTIDTIILKNTEIDSWWQDCLQFP